MAAAQAADAGAALIQAARWLTDNGYNVGSSGNLSVRVDGGMLITPSALAADALTGDDLVLLDLAGGRLAGDRVPSSEWRLHASVYAVRADAHALVHTHATHVTALACHGRELPAFHYMVAQFGGDCVPCAPYATFGTQALSDAVTAALGADFTACLMANHGSLTLGTTLDSAVGKTVALEQLVQVYLTACALGPPRMLDAAQMAAVAARFRRYAAGQSLEEER